MLPPLRSPASPFGCPPYLTFGPGHDRAVILARHSRITSDDLKISFLNGALVLEHKGFTCTVCIIYG